MQVFITSYGMVIDNPIFSIQIRRKLKADIIGIKLLEEAAQKFGTILLDYSKVLFELLDAFLRDKTSTISSFANAGYRLIFGIDSCDRKVLLSRLVGFVCERNAHALVMADPSAAAAQNDLTTSALMILSEINQKHSAEMKFNGLQVLVRQLSISNARNIFNIRYFFSVCLITPATLHSVSFVWSWI